MKLSSTTTLFIATSITFLSRMLLFRRSDALAASFNSDTCEEGVTNTTNWYTLDTGGDNGTCYDIGQLYGDMLTPVGYPPSAFCSYYENGGGNAMNCPGPLPFSAISVQVNQGFTPSGTTCNMYFASGCQTDTGTGASVAPTPYFVYTVTDGACSDTPQRLPLSESQGIQSFECFPPS